MNLLYNIVTDLVEIKIRLEKNIKALINSIAPETVEKPVEDSNESMIRNYLITQKNNLLNIFNAMNGDLLYSDLLKLNFVIDKVTVVENDFLLIHLTSRGSGLKIVNQIITIQLSNMKSLTQVVEPISLQIETAIKELTYNSNNISHNIPCATSGMYIHHQGDLLYGLNLTEKSKDLKDSSLGICAVSIAWTRQVRNLIKYEYSNASESSISTYMSGGNIYYKYIDPNLLLILLKDNDNLIVEIVDALHGKTLFKSIIEKVDFNQSLDTLFDENLLVVYYTRKDKYVTRNEIFVVEAMRREIEQSFVVLVDKILNDFSVKEPSNLKNDLVFLTQTFVLTKKVKGLFSSRSNLSIANKSILILYESNLLAVYDRRLLSPRRPIFRDTKGKGTPEFDPALNSQYVDMEYTPYSPILGIDYKTILSENFVSHQIDSVTVGITEYESTYVLCSLGLGIKCYKVFPDKNFDSLASNFSYSIIAIFVSALTVSLFT